MFRAGLLFAVLIASLAIPSIARPAPYAAFVIDARSGEVLHARNADTRLHPASLTKMMTLYITFEAIRRGEISLETKVRISSNAASEPPSKLGLKSGQTIELKYLIRAAAIKSANDAATALGEAIEGSEAAFARRMTRTAAALGMTRTTFKNAHGLTEEGHLSTARDMTMLGRRLLYDYPQYYNLFSRRTEDAGVRQVNNTNRRLLSQYAGADGIKTGYTSAAGFNLVASAVRGNERVIATVFGGRSTAARNAKVAELLDLGFKRSPNNAPVSMPAAPQYVAEADPGLQGKTIRLITTVSKSVRPQPRPNASPTLVAEPEAPALMVAQAEGADAQTVIALAVVAAPPPRPETLVAEAPKGAAEPLKLEVVTRLSTSGGRGYGINVGSYASKYEAERVLLKTALIEIGTLDEALRKVVTGRTGYEANFVGMTEDMAALACRRLEARRVTCSTFGPS
ncbi:D-alanyl-D-alanine carboxypeptidase family protein [Oceaniovalibus sp. ACAM 378]|uniref:D-alanyl-D-alanine carboxypeptidase family protein n=1 Tax=Oceaniovalibus sp. ACAM 378 TaxID=2599923 RepID=UPI0011D3C772|nr:D-alanyl-D-alanine carboxypeptidase family protein [Oceaniovalibus sp. ACAM 378]TYB86462.1 D-alanyl-D-alanine carboxypeptidase [Oceaniovalibus sp. ACAM 378]